MQPRAQLAGDQALTSAGTAQAPYVGLRPYEPEEHEWFFGRDQDAVFLGDKIVVSPLTILYSASGLGKSSSMSCTSNAPDARPLRASSTVSVG